MALSAAEEAQTRELLAQQAAILALAAEEPAIISSLGATDVSLSDLAAASSISGTDLLLVRQGVTDKSATASQLAAPTATDTIPGVSALAVAANYPSASDTESATPAYVAAAVASGSSIAPVLITGLLPTSISGTNTTASVTISSGQATNSTGVKNLIGPGHSWLVSNGNAANGYQGGATLPNSSTIHFFECWGGSGYCSFASTSLTPTAPAGYNTYYRRIFSLNTTAAGALVAGSMSEIYGGAVQFSHSTPLLDVSATPTSANRTLYALTVPSGVKIQAVGRVNGYLLGVSNSALVTSPEETDSVVGAFSSVTTATYDVAVDSASRYYFQPISRPLITNTSGQIGIRSLVASGTVYWLTSGFIDFRRG